MGGRLVALGHSSFSALLFLVDFALEVVRVVLLVVRVFSAAEVLPRTLLHLVEPHLIHEIKNEVEAREDEAEQVQAQAVILVQLVPVVSEQIWKDLYDSEPGEEDDSSEEEAQQEQYAVDDEAFIILIINRQFLHNGAHVQEYCAEFREHEIGDDNANPAANEDGSSQRSYTHDVVELCLPYHSALIAVDRLQSNQVINKVRQRYHEVDLQCCACLIKANVRSNKIITGH